MTKKKNKTDHEILKMELDVYRYPPETYFFRTLIGDGDVNGVPVELSTNSSGEFMVRIGTGSWYLIDIRKFIEAVAEAEGVPAKE